MNTIARLFFKMIVIVTITFSISSCKKTFDAPPGPGEVNLVANKTIAGLKSYHTIAGVYDLISQDIIICGTVIANDQSGNFYKQLFIQDSTGAIQLLLDAYSIYNSYPVGRKVYIKCNGLTLSDANSTMVLGIKAIVDGSPSMEGIPASVANQYLVGATLNNPVEPITVTLADLGSNMNSRYINALVKLNGYEFASADTSKAYGDTSSFKATVNRNVNLGCGSTINTIVRTSGYANFAAVRLPKGNGSIAAIYTIY